MSSEVRERWAQMPTVYGIEPRSKAIQIGWRTWEVPVFLLDQDGIDRIRLGYICIVCLERHQTPWPERCALTECNFPIREYQREVFDHLYLGEVDYGPMTSLSEEWEIAKDEVARKRREKQLKKSSIWLPRSIRD